MGARLIKQHKLTEQARRLRVLKKDARVKPGAVSVTVVQDTRDGHILAVGADRDAAIAWCTSHPNAGQYAELIDMQLEV